MKVKIINHTFPEDVNVVMLIASTLPRAELKPKKINIMLKL